MPAGCLIELFFEAKSGSADVDRNAVEATIAASKIISEVSDFAGNMAGHPEERSCNVETSRIVVDDDNSLSSACQHGCEIATAAPENEHVGLRGEKTVHHLDVFELTFAPLRAVALKNFAFEIHTRPVALVFPNVDLSQFTLVTTDHFHRLHPFMMYITWLAIYYISTNHAGMQV